MRYPGPGSDAERTRFASLQQRLLPLYRAFSPTGSLPEPLSSFPA